VRREVPQRICVAQIGAPHGVRGEVRLRSFTADPAAVRSYGPLDSEDGGTHVEITALRPAGGHFVARLRGVEDRQAAERLTNLRLFVPRERLPPPGPDEFYHADLIGLTAVTVAGERVGEVIAVHDFGGGAVLELGLGDGGRTAMLPFAETFVPAVDIANGNVTVALPDDAP
jgi:16S rRNA processing protein RimM